MEINVFNNKVQILLDQPVGLLLFEDEKFNSLLNKIFISYNATFSDFELLITDFETSNIEKAIEAILDFMEKEEIV